MAQEALRVAQETGDERLTDELCQTVGALSPTVEEALRTAIRMRMAEKRGYDFLRTKRSQGPMTFGEIAYMVLNQTLVRLELQKAA